MLHTSSCLVAALLVATGLRAADAPAPVPLEKALQAITLPAGFKATLFAGEPDLVQPLAMTTDTRGRLWVIECLSYPNWTTNKTGSDRISIYEDSNGDGRFDKKTVFFEKGRNLSGIALGYGGVFVCSLPELLFIPDRNFDDKPDAEPEVLLDGILAASTTFSTTPPGALTAGFTAAMAFSAIPSSGSLARKRSNGFP